MELLASYNTGKNHVMLFDTAIICSIEQSNVNMFEDIIEAIEKNDPDDLLDELN